MAEPRLSKILIGTLMIGLFSLAFMLFLNEGADEYNVEGYSNSSLEQFSTTSREIEGVADDARGNLSKAGAGSSSSFDIFGSFFSSTWTALKSTWNSMSTIGRLSTQAVDEVPNMNSQFATQLKIFLTTIISIIFIIAIYFSFIKPSSRL